MIYIRDVRNKQITTLTEAQEEMMPPKDGNATGSTYAVTTETPQEIAQAWCQFWSQRNYLYEPVGEDGWTPDLFE